MTLRNSMVKTFWLPLLIWLIPLLTFSQAIDREELSKDSVLLPELIKVATQQNPTLRAARHRWKAAIEKYPQAKALPDPTISYVYYDESVETRVGPQEHRLGISQGFPFPGTLKAKGKIALEGIKIAQVNHERALRDLIVDVKLSFYELAYLNHALKITSQSKALAQNAAKLAAAHYAKEEATLNDLLTAQAQEAQLAYDLILIEELQEVEKAQLRALLNVPTSAKVGDPKMPALRPFLIAYTDIEKQALANRQELKIAALKVAQAEAGISLARRSRLPRFTASAATILTGDAANPAVEDSGKDPVMYGLSMSLPLNLSKNSAMVKQAEAERDAVRADVEAAENMTRAVLKKTYFKVQNSKRLVSLYEKSLIPQAKKAMELSETWNVDGTHDFSAYLETQSVWLNFNLARLRAVTDYHQNLAKLERLAGGAIKSPEKVEESKK